MSKEKNFLLGQGERLTAKVKVPTGGSEKNPPYDFSSAKQRIAKNLVDVVRDLDLVPSGACPNNEVVSLLTMHPRYISKTDFPEDLLKSVGLRSIGSRSTSIKPEKWGIKKHPDDEVITEQVFVAGTKEAYHQWSDKINGWSANQKSTLQLTKVEKVSAYLAKDKIKSVPTDRDEAMLEVVIHNSSNKSIIDNFEAYVQTCGAKALMDKKRDVGGLTFIPVKAPVVKALDIAQFSFLRALRGMPSLRPINLNNITRDLNLQSVILPNGSSLNPSVNAVIFDGGISGSSSLSKWANAIDPTGIGPAVPSYVEHGIAVTSAFLFGHIISPNLERPFCNVDHVRVLDRDTGKNDLDIVDVLDRILSHMKANKGKYHLMNLSIGPDLSITDDDVTAWTASLDELLSNDDIFTTVAVGNTGHLDAASGLNRVQVPSDAVNVLAVGACDTTNLGWNRAEYSCIGPGRRPGVVKPDGLAFGGSDNEMFSVLSASSKPFITTTSGTSFASPSTLRSGAGIKSYIGDDISQRAIHALMIHKAKCNGLPRIDVGWGRFETDVNQLVTCDDNEAIVIYQGELPIGEHLRAQIPMPDNLILTGKVDISATLVIKPETDPEHPGAYTKAGLEVFFRPHSEKFTKYKDGRTSKHPKTTSFFSQKNMYGKAEYDFRSDGSKWEPCLKNTQKFNAQSLKEPCFDIYYHHREGAVTAKDPKPIKYALVVGIKTHSIPDFYNQIVRSFSNILVPLRPKVEIQIQT